MRSKKEREKIKARESPPLLFIASLLRTALHYLNAWNRLLSCVVHGPIYGLFMGYVTGFLPFSQGKRPGDGVDFELGLPVVLRRVIVM